MSTAVVSAELRDALGRHNKLDAQLYAHASQRYRTCVHQAALQLWPSAPLPTSATPLPPAAAADGPARPDGAELVPGRRLRRRPVFAEPAAPARRRARRRAGRTNGALRPQIWVGGSPGGARRSGVAPVEPDGAAAAHRGGGHERHADGGLRARSAGCAPLPPRWRHRRSEARDGGGAAAPVHARRGRRERTGQYDQYRVSDTPVAQVAQLLLQTHSVAQVAAVLALRDPWAVVSRTNSHSQYNESEARAVASPTTTLPYPCRAGARGGPPTAILLGWKRGRTRADGKRHWKGSMGTRGCSRHVRGARLRRADAAYPPHRRGARLAHPQRVDILPRAPAARAAVRRQPGRGHALCAGCPRPRRHALLSRTPHACHPGLALQPPRRLRGGSHWAASV